MKPSCRHRFLAGILQVPLLTALLVSDASTGSAATRYVSTNGLQRAPFSSWENAARNIQDAIDVAEDGDVVVVGDGRYSGPGNHNISYRGRAIELRSRNGPGNCIIDTQSANEKAFVFNAGEGRDCILSGFTIVRGGGHSVITCNESSPTIKDCIISNSAVGNFVDASPIFRRCRITEARTIYCDGGEAEFESCLLLNSNQSDYDGLLWAGMSTIYRLNTVLKLRNCTLINYNFDMNDSLVVIENCILWGNEPSFHGLWLAERDVSYSCIQGGLEGEGNIKTDPMFLPGDDYLLDPHSPCVDTGKKGAMSDIEGESRPIDGNGDGKDKWDIGADEYKGTMTFTVAGDPAEIGGPVPHGYGDHAVPIKSLVINEVPAEFTDTNGVTHVCTGWSMSGGVTASGTNTKVAVAIKADTSLVWHWRSE